MLFNAVYRRSHPTTALHLIQNAYSRDVNIKFYQKKNKTEPRHWEKA